MLSSDIAPPTPARRAGWILSTLLIISVLIVSLIFLDTGGKGASMFIIGILLGGVFISLQYGFAGAWRALLVQGNTVRIANIFVLVGLCAVVFIPAKTWGIQGMGTLAPISISLFIGSFIFGMGMQLANGCGSGVLCHFGTGSGRMLIALPFFIIGSVLGSFILPPVLNWGAINPVVIGAGLSDISRMGVNVILIGAVAIPLFI